jgi:hypothetical protein
MASNSFAAINSFTNSTVAWWAWALANFDALGPVALTAVITAALIGGLDEDKIFADLTAWNDFRTSDILAFDRRTADQCTAFVNLVFNLALI